MAGFDRDDVNEILASVSAARRRLPARAAEAERQPRRDPLRDRIFALLDDMDRAPLKDLVEAVPARPAAAEDEASDSRGEVRKTIEYLLSDSDDLVVIIDAETDEVYVDIRL